MLRFTQCLVFVEQKDFFSGVDTQLHVLDLKVCQLEVQLGG